MKRGISALLMVILLFQALPLNALADVGGPISDEELQMALQLAGLRIADGNGDGTVRVETAESSFHKGMKPNMTWDARMLADWLDDLLDTELYSAVSTFTEILTILEQLEKDEPARYAALTSSSTYAEYLEKTRTFAGDARAAEQEARLLHERLTEYTVVIQQNTETLANAAGGLFEHEILTLSEQIREAADQLDELREDTMAFGITQVLVIMAKQFLMDGKTEPGYTEWAKGILAIVDPPKQVNGTFSSAPTGQLAAANTRMSRMTAMADTRVLSGSGGSNDFRIQVLDKNQFAIVVHGVDNKPVVDVKVTVKDLRTGVEKTVYTEDPDFGSALFAAADFDFDHDQEAEISVEVDGTNVGYRSCYTPWMLMKQGGVRTFVLTLLTDEAFAGDKTNRLKTAGVSAVEQQRMSYAAAKTETVKPYVYACYFNGVDIFTSQKVLKTSSLNNYDFDFTLEVENPSGVQMTAPVFHYWSYDEEHTSTKDPKEHKMNPTKTEQVTSTMTRYTYTAKWKQVLSPDIKEDQKVYFEFPSLGDKMVPMLEIKRSKVDQPIVAGTEKGGPLQKVIGDGLGFDFTIPGIGDTISLGIPYTEYMPRIKTDGLGYVTITVGSSLVEPKKGDWKNKEQEKYDKEMKNYEYECTTAGIKQKLGTAYKYYKNHKPMAAMKGNIGWFAMLAGRWEKDDEFDGTTYWSAGGTAGITVSFGFDFTEPFAIGPVPVYVNINFSVSVGFGVNIGCRMLLDKNGGYEDFKFDLVGITLEIRLALTITVGVGIKGIASIWVSATGSLNMIFQFMRAEPVHVAIYVDFVVTIGFEIFFITYSHELWRLPEPVLLYKNFDSGNRPFNLLMAYADADEAAQEPDTVNYEPEKYVTGAQKLEKISYSIMKPASRNVKISKIGSHVTYFALVHDDKPYVANDKNQFKIECCSTESAPAMSYWARSYFAADMPEKENYQEYDFDIYNDGTYTHLLVLCARNDQFGQDGKPLDMAEIMLYYARLAPDEKPGGFMLKSVCTQYYKWNRSTSNGLSPICTHPRIESVVQRDGKYEICGTLKGQNENVEESQYNLFHISDRTDGKTQWEIYGDCAVGSRNYGNNYIRSEARISLRSDELDKVSEDEPNFICPEFIGLDQPRGENEGDSYLFLYRFPRSVKSKVEIKEESDRPSKIYTSRKNKIQTYVLAQGDIGSFEMVQTLGKDGKSTSKTIFYTQKETVGERTENRLKSIYILPADGKNNKEIQEYELVYTDYDLSIPASDFRAVEVGASQYLYWLQTAPKKKATDPDLWRVTAVYYDSATGSISDEIVVAEFSLPDSTWNGTTYRSVPHEITLTPDGIGYITTRPDTGEEMSQAAPVTLYKFSSRLITSAALQGVAVTDNVVTQGTFVSADLSMINNGNTGLGSFIADVILMENGQEKEVVETLYANLLYPADSKLVMAKNNETVAKGESAIYRLKDFVYSPRQHEWIIQSKSQKLLYKYDRATVTNLDNKANRLTTDVLVPGAFGGYTSHIKVPNDWAGKYELRVKITDFSGYSNFIAASELAKKRPELFAFENTEQTERDGLLKAQGIQRLDYHLDEKRGKMVLQKQGTPSLLMASAGGVLSPGSSVRMLAANITNDNSGEMPKIYATEVEAPEPVSIELNVHDIDVSHHVYRDYYGDEMVEISIHNYYNNDQPIRLYCTIYEDNNSVGRNFNLPHDQESISAGKTQTITIPLTSMVDINQHERIRVVIKGIGISDESAMLNNEFEIYFGRKVEEPAAAPTIVPVTGDNAQPVLWIGLIVLGVISLLAAGGLVAIRKKKEKK